MAIEFARAHVLSRSGGHSAVKASAYRAGQSLRDDRIGRTADYSHRSSDVLCAKVLLPEGADPALADRKTLWNAVEQREDQHNRRASAQLAKDYIIALPRQLSDSQRIDLAESFARSELVSRGLVVDMAVHAHSEGNPHAHLMTTTRRLEGSEFTSKVREVNGKFYGGAKLADEVQLRHRWADFQNSYFKENGIEMTVTNHNGEYEAEKHLGAAHQMADRGIKTELNDQVVRVRSAREQAIFNKPEIVIERVADKRAVFTRHDLYRELAKVVKSAEAFSEIKAKIDVHPSLVSMVSKGDEKEYLTTLDVLTMEHSIRLTSDQLMVEDKRFSISDRVKESVMKDYGFLSDEQKGAVSHLTDSKRLGLVMGLAGAGKSTMLEAVRRINEQSGHRVLGVALAGKAADELEKSSGISSTTIASFLYGIKSGRVEIGAGDVLAIDEFGMVSNKQAEALLRVAEAAGAKVIAVGDTEQLQSIQSGAVLRDLSDRHGYAAIETIRRQQTAWQRKATFQLAKGRAVAAIDAYRQHGHVQAFAKTGAGDSAVQAIIADYLKDTKEGSKAVLAHRRGDVKMLNTGIRQGLIDAGQLEPGRGFTANTGRDEQRLVFDLEPGDEVIFKSDDKGLGICEQETATFVGVENNELAFVHETGRAMHFSADRYHDLEIPDKESVQETLDLSVGDRVLFTRNDAEVGVKNGQLGDLVAYTGDTLSVRMESGELISFTQDEYSDIAHGYATTIHKSQGMTVDRSYLLGTGSMDRHLAYVGMSRHRESMEIYTSEEDRFLYAASRDNRQETALDFSERRGLELESEEHSETIKRILNGREVNDMAVEGEIVPISNDDYRRANQLLEEEQSKIAMRLTEEAKQPVQALERKAQLIAAEIRTLQDNRPTVGFFNKRAGEEQVRTWQLDIDLKTAEREGILRDVKYSSEEREYAETQSRIEKEATRQAEIALPKQTQIMDNYHADVKIVELTTKLDTLNKEITQAKVDDSEKKLPRLLKQKSNTLNDLRYDKSLFARQSRSQRQGVEKAIASIDKELGLFKDNGLSLGR